MITPPWSTITAYDLNSGKIKWQTPYGDTPEAGPSDKLRGNVFPKSGFVILASGLVVFVDNQSKLYALDQMTGKVIFTKRRSQRGSRRAGGLRSERARVHSVCPDRGPCFSRGCEDGARRCEPTGRLEELRCFRAATVIVAVAANDESHARVRRMIMKHFVSERAGGLMRKTNRTSRRS